ncbi:hypothetical protein NPIL_520331 [Nephila pilipes]|uniref:Uncharacterized protein n=1 Tax=Nephila pilipes TaxID=299642 RepID=A0A8X6TGE6_NEPPI|nr:hypothetical protein NPIL_520331 [Nephila pilipes]
MIVDGELESSFKDIWKYKTRYEFPNSGRAKKCVQIQDPFHLARAIVYWYNKQWGVPIHVTGRINCVIPLDRRYKPTKEHTSLYLTLHGDKKMYLERGNTEQEARCSFQCVRDETYVLSREQQLVMNEIKEMRDIVKMEQEVQWKCKVTEVTAE